MHAYSFLGIRSCKRNWTSKPSIFQDFQHHFYTFQKNFNWYLVKNIILINNKGVNNTDTQFVFIIILLAFYNSLVVLAIIDGNAIFGNGKQESNGQALFLNLRERESWQYNHFPQHHPLRNKYRWLILKCDTSLEHSANALLISTQNK